jgi:hypothetical protein
MKKIIFITSSLVVVNSYAQFGDLKKAIGKPKEALQSITGAKKDSSLTTNDLIGGLKEALNKGIEKGTSQLSAVDGFNGNELVKVLLPDEAKKVEEKLRSVGMGKQVDEAILSMNRAAEDATKTAAPIFLNAIKNMSFADAWAIFRGNDNAATNYLKQQTTNSLTTAFRPIIEEALQKTGATKHWNTIFSNYNKFSFNKVNPDLTAHVTEKAMSGIFYQLAIEEGKIRKDPAARTTDILKNVFGSNK